VVAGVARGAPAPDVSARATTISTTSTTIPFERPQAQWAVATSSSRGVMVDYRMIGLSGVWYRAIRLRARTTLLRWHVGYQDPPTRVGQIPADAGPRINWPNEGLAGVVAVFNGGFKVAAHAGGSMVDGVTLSPMVPGDMTLAIDAAGHWKMGLWMAGFPGANFHAIALRQNLGPLIANGRVTHAALYANPFDWGSPLKNVVLEPRTALGIDAHGNLVYVATMQGVTPGAIATALLAAGAVEGMELDMNPFWPVVGASFQVLHQPGGYPVQIPYSEHNPTIFNTGWERDFFVALAEPSNWKCSWTSAGLAHVTGAAQPQPLRETCAGASSSSPAKARLARQANA
jgi:Phosphodiester glycosidase